MLILGRNRQMDEYYLYYRQFKRIPTQVPRQFNMQRITISTSGSGITGY